MKIQKLAGALVFLSLGTAFLTSCSNQERMGKEDALDRIRRTGVIQACTFVYPPYGIKNAKTGAYSGVYVDAMNLIGEKMNAKVVWHEVASGTAIADLVSGKCDVIPANFALIPRAETVAFLEPPLGFIGEGALVRKDDARFKNVKSPLEFDKPDLTVAVLNGESGDIYVREHFRNAKVVKIDADASDQTRFCVEVSAKRADVAISDTNTLSLYAKAHPETVDLFHDRPFGLSPMSWTVRQGDLKWLHFLETALQFLETQGTLAQLEKKYNAHLLHEVRTYRQGFLNQFQKE